MNHPFSTIVLRRDPRAEVLLWKEYSYSSEEFRSLVERARGALQEAGIPRGAVVSLEAGFQPFSIAMLLALLDHKCIVVPITSHPSELTRRKIAISEVEFRCQPTARPVLYGTRRRATHALIRKLREDSRAGLILFSSGATEDPKAAIHDAEKLLLERRRNERPHRTVCLLEFDHIGGLNTLFHAMRGGGVAILVQAPDPHDVFAAVARHRAELLPASPTFLRLARLYGALGRHDASSLKLVTYGTEGMPQRELDLLKEALPGVRLLQTYGLTELGIPRTSSEGCESLWFKLEDEAVQSRVVDGCLELRTPSAMLGYLNAPSPFTEDGFFRTGDSVETKNGYMRVLGRRQEVINVGGRKVFPNQVEEVLQQMRGVVEASVSGRPNPVLTQIVFARVRLATQESKGRFKARMRAFCSERLEKFMIPCDVDITASPLHGSRLKKIRAASGSEGSTHAT